MYSSSTPVKCHWRSNNSNRWMCTPFPAEQIPICRSHNQIQILQAQMTTQGKEWECVRQYSAIWHLSSRPRRKLDHQDYQQQEWCHGDWKPWMLLPLDGKSVRTVSYTEGWRTFLNKGSRWPEIDCDYRYDQSPVTCHLVSSLGMQANSATHIL